MTDFSSVNCYDDVIEKISSFVNVLELGCGKEKLPFAYGVDIENFDGVDAIVDLNGPFPFADNSYDIVISNQVLEHIDNLTNLMNESHRVLKKGGIFIASVPYFRSSWSVVDPTHVRFFSMQTMNYYVSGKLQHDLNRFIEPGFSSIELQLDVLSGKGFFKKMMSKVALRYPSHFENSALSFLCPFQDLTCFLKK
jgi:SAM-dependent methyltransferase